MRFGPLCLRLVALVVAATLSHDLAAQTGRGGYPMPQPTAAGGAGPMQAMFQHPGGPPGQANPYTDAYGTPAMVPASYGAPCGAGCSGCAGCGGGYPPVYGHGGAPCDYGQMGTCPPFEGGREDYSLMRPFRTEQCGPHYWDVRMEAVWLTREETFKQDVDFTSLNVVDPNNPVPGQFVVNSGLLDFDYEPGFRILGRYDVGPLSVLEFGYMGVQNFDTRAAFTDPDPVDPNTGNLYSLFSDFVEDPAALPPGVTTPDSGVLPATERSITHSITLESELHVAEMNYRRYWVGFSPCVSGTMLCGFRFTRLREDFDFSTSGEADGQYLMLAKNDMAGFQLGGDMWVHLLRGLRAGIEGKAGLYNNHYTLNNRFTSTQAEQEGVFSEQFEKDIPAFIGEVSLDMVADLTPSWSLRAGYEIHYLNSVVLAGENFNTGTIYNDVPGVLLPERVPFINNQGHAIYHGAHLGAEYVW